ncbi:MAG: thioredoxin family protein [Cyanobacteriota bacterium SKYGB_h_bin112]|nr:thioredoxin family protein [Cyanobacteriota bacterium SKYGB_h_bin112]
MTMIKFPVRNHLVGLAIAATLVATACAPKVTETTASPEATASPAQTVAATDASATKADVSVGKPAPNFTAVDSNGKSHQLSDFKGKVVVLEWTNHECPFVRKHYESENMQKIQKQATEKGVVWLSVVSSAPGNQGYVDGAKANSLTKERNASPTAVLLDPDGKLGRLYGARTTPHMFVIAADGTLAYMGAIDSIASSNKADVAKAENYVTKAIEQVLKGEPVTNAVTQPYGCSVKYAS